MSAPHTTTPDEQRRAMLMSAIDTIVANLDIVRRVHAGEINRAEAIRLVIETSATLPPFADLSEVERVRIVKELMF